jgi:hypothetical protein
VKQETSQGDPIRVLWGSGRLRHHLLAEVIGWSGRRSRGASEQRSDRGHTCGETSADLRGWLHVPHLLRTACRDRRHWPTGGSGPRRLTFGRRFYGAAAMVVADSPPVAAARRDCRPIAGPRLGMGARDFERERGPRRRQLLGEGRAAAAGSASTRRQLGSRDVGRIRLARHRAHPLGDRGDVPIRQRDAELVVPHQLDRGL